jgi:hypothetical protein
VKCVADVEKMYDIATCLNLKMKNFLSVRKWQRMRQLLACKYVDGRWVRNTVGTSNVQAPMLPEHRNIVNVMRSIEQDFGMFLDGEGDGKSVSTNVRANIEADIVYAVDLGLLKINSRGEIVCALTDELLKLQFKMDAGGVWKGVQQTSIAYVLICQRKYEPKLPAGHHRVLCV